MLCNEELRRPKAEDTVTLSEKSSRRDKAGAHTGTFLKLFQIALDYGQYKTRTADWV